MPWRNLQPVQHFRGAVASHLQETVAGVHDGAVGKRRVAHRERVPQGHDAGQPLDAWGAEMPPPASTVYSTPFGAAIAPGGVSSSLRYHTPSTARSDGTSQSDAERAVERDSTSRDSKTRHKSSPLRSRGTRTRDESTCVARGNARVTGRFLQIVLGHQVRDPKPDPKCACDWTSRRVPFLVG